MTIRNGHRHAYNLVAYSDTESTDYTVRLGLGVKPSKIPNIYYRYRFHLGYIGERKQKKPKVNTH